MEEWGTFSGDSAALSFYFQPTTKAPLKSGITSERRTSGSVSSPNAAPYKARWKIRVSGLLGDYGNLWLNHTQTNEL